MCAAVEETNIGAILTAMNTNELVVEIRPGKIKEIKSLFSWYSFPLFL